jgi:hypothetical protein
MNPWVVNAAIWVPLLLNIYMRNRIEHKLSAEDSAQWREEARQWQWQPFKTSSKYQELFPESNLPVIDRCLFVLGLIVLLVHFLRLTLK